MENNQQNKVNYNILILGEPGVGKSTFINAFANYVNFPTLDDVLQAEKIHVLIPTKFAVTDSDFNPIEIKFGEDKNESLIGGQSSIQQCKSYKFEFDDMVIRLIDTPSVGDTRGIKQDEKDFDNILNYFGKFKKLSAIVMLKPDESRVTVLFEYCIKQLLSSFEKSAVDNIVFLFTNSRGTWYRPGDTVGPLKTVLKEIENTPPNVKVPFEKKNLFCLDNEAFRYLLARREGYEFDEDAEISFRQSWNTSASVCKDLIKYITGLKPHCIQNTVSVIEARRVTLGLSEPLTEIAELIKNNTNRMRRLERELTDTKKLNKTNEIEDIQEQLRKYQAEREEFENEQKIIQQSGTMFAHFLSNSVILPFNDAYKEYTGWSKIPL